jgi:hypothetical protein
LVRSRILPGGGERHHQRRGQKQADKQRRLDKGEQLKDRSRPPNRRERQTPPSAGDHQHPRRRNNRERDGPEQHLQMIAESIAPAGFG